MATDPDAKTKADRPYQPPDMPTLIPYICPRDAARAIDWYCDIFGATETGSRFVGPDGRVGHADLVIGDSPLMLSDAHPEIGVDAPAEDDRHADYSLQVYVPDVDATVTRAARQGAEVEREPNDEFYGSRTSVIRDPFGVRWMISTHQRQVGEQEYQAAVDAYGQGEG